ncbi:ANGPTL7 [Branchiostoma lanceolatum]|uniref:ANGPTL7 protein n=1 Tax=Branchiostoma lanceolatum TaxID=7740 RepID=A0A8K0E453_BRALA|nr:ANGPTL7 [Branchiostoma lanceolatum]
MKGGWWYTQCGDFNLNGLYHRQGEHAAQADGVFWWWWKRDWYSLKSVEMAVFPHYYPVYCTVILIERNTFALSISERNNTTSGIRTFILRK